MIAAWLASHDPSRIFLESAEGILRYRDLLAASSSARGQILWRGRGSLADIADLLTLPGPGRQLVVIDRRLPAPEQRRRAAAAAAASTRSGVMILFTSGTTGPAKGVRLTWENWEAAVAASAEHLGHGPDDTWLAVMPLHHVGGLAILLRSAYVGARVRWLPAFRTDEVVRSLRSGVTFASFVPAMLRRVLDYDGGHYHSLRAVLVGGGPIPPGLLEEAHARGIPALPTYGMTETCAQVATLRPGSPLRYAVDLVGGMEARLDPDGRIELRGRQVSPGYVDDDDRSAEAWLPTGDLGSFEPDGALRVLGRADSVIITGGEKVDPRRVEAVISDHPGVESVTLRGEVDPEWGQRIVALYRGVVTPEDLREWCRSRLAYYEVPRHFVREEPRAQSS